MPNRRQRRAMARSLERGEDRLSSLFCVLDDDMVRKAADKVKQRGEQMNKFAAKAASAGGSSASGQGSKSGGKGSQSKGAGKGESKENRTVRSPQRAPKRARDEGYASWGKSSQWSDWGKKQGKK